MDTAKLVTADAENLDSKLIHRKGQTTSVPKRSLGLRDGQTPRRALNDVRNVNVGQTPSTHHNTKQVLKQTVKETVVEEEEIEFCPPPPKEPADDGFDVLGPVSERLSSIPKNSWNNLLKFPVYTDPMLPTDEQIDAYLLADGLISEDEEDVDFCSKKTSDLSFNGGRVSSPPESPLPAARDSPILDDSLSEQDIQTAIDRLLLM